MIRTLYLIISTLILVGSFAIPIYFVGGKGFASGIILYCLYALMTLVASFMSMYKGITPGNPGDVITPPFGFLTFGFKRVYYSDLGHFWIRKSSSGQVYLYEQKLFVIYKIGEVYWDGNIEHLKLEIKKELEEIYKVQLSLKRKRDLDKKLWSEWDGAVDKKSERDNKLNELGV